MPSAADARPSPFPNTQWTLVLAAGSDASVSGPALESMCRAYWYPLYAYVRRRGHDVEDGRDLTQGFFVALLEKNLVAEADRARGKFRSFLLGALNHFLANEWDKSQRLKRGGGERVLSLDALTAEDRYQHEPADGLTPESLFDRSWAQTVLERVLAGLRGEFERAGQVDRFDACKPWLLGEKEDRSYAAVAEQLGLGEPGVRSIVHRMRRRFRELTRAEIAQTVTTPQEVDEEIQALFRALAG
jgi:DNA-directed RNA polymerase specialized sigma24 family protein